MEYANILTKISERIKKGSNKNWIIIGDNSSGKSDLLRKLVSEINEPHYYIDTVNRYFDVKNIDVSTEAVNFNVTSEEIIRERIKPTNYNLQDSFGRNDHIERLYCCYEVKVKELVKQFLDVDIYIEREQLGEGFGEGDIYVKINGKEAELSSGYQAVVRLFAELVFFVEVLNEKGIIVIDEVDEFLSPKHSGRILNFLMEKFPENYFIVSTHSSDLIANSCNCSIVALGNNNFSVVDGNDFTTLNEANMLFNRILGNEEEIVENESDVLLQRLFDLKVTGNWMDEDDVELNSIDFEQLTPVQKVIYKQIKEW